MNFESNLTYNYENNDQLRLSINRAVKVGYQGVVMTVNVTTMKKYPPPPDPLPISPDMISIVQRNCSLYVLGDHPKFPQFTRLNLVTDNIQEIHQLGRVLNDVKYDLVSVTPLSDNVFKAACSSLDIDILCFDVNKYLPIKCWKELKSLVNRDIAIELSYSAFLKGEQSMKHFISAAQSIIQATKGRHSKNRMILLGCGSDDPDMLRGPEDVRCLARLVGLPKVETMNNALIKKLIGKGLARKSNSGTVRKLKERIIENAQNDDDLFGFTVVTD